MGLFEPKFNFHFGDGIFLHVGYLIPAILSRIVPQDALIELDYLRIVIRGFIQLEAPSVRKDEIADMLVLAWQAIVTKLLTWRNTTNIFIWIVKGGVTKPRVLT